MVGNLALTAVAVLAPSLLFWFLLRVPRMCDWVAEAIRERRARFEPTAPPIEQLAADLRRVHRVIVDSPPGTPMVRRRAAAQAYDTLLSQACAAVDVQHRLDTLPAEGMDRDLERLRIEEALRAAGLMVP